MENSFEAYVNELQSGRLLSSSLFHVSDEFWRKNVHRFDENDHEVLRQLIELLNRTHDPQTLGVGSLDLFKYARHSPGGAEVIERLGAKVRVKKNADI